MVAERERKKNKENLISYHGPVLVTCLDCLHSVDTVGLAAKGFGREMFANY